MPRSAPGRGRRSWSPAPMRCRPSPRHRARTTNCAACRSSPSANAPRKAMRDGGFTDVSSADGNVGDLAELAATRMKPRSAAALSCRRGALRRSRRRCSARKNFTVDTALVYRAVTAERLPRQAAAALAAGIDGVLHFSRRSAEAYVDAARNAGLLEGALNKPVPFLSVRPGCGTADAGRRGKHAHRGAAGRSRLDRTMRLNMTVLHRLVRFLNMLPPSPPRTMPWRGSFGAPRLGESVIGELALRTA